MNYQIRAPRPSFIPHLSTLLILLLLLALSGCGIRRTPDLERIFAAARERKDKRPIIVIPGILGSQLVNRRTGEVVWPSLLFHSAGQSLRLPTTPDLASNRDDLIATRIVETAKLVRLTPEIYVYYQLLDALRRYGGYHDGNWDNPGPDGDRDTFYVFAYDWRRDNVETARELMQRIEELKTRLHRPDLRFNIVAHSMGGLIARYAAMYGDRDLPAGDSSPQPTWAGASAINKVFMFGTPNEGSAEAFATLIDGYSVTEGLRRRIRLFSNLSRDDALTIPSLFELLPDSAATRFLDENLAPVAIDLYDPAVWKRYGWSAITDPAYRERVAHHAESPPLSAHDPYSLGDLDAYFAAVLKRAKLFHESLDATSDTKQASVALFAFGGDCEETLAAPIILHDEKSGRWITLITPRAFHTSTDHYVSRAEATRAMYEPGDGRVTRRSLLGETLAARRGSALFDTALPIAYAVFACDVHSELQNNKTLQDNALTLLVSEAIK